MLRQPLNLIGFAANRACFPHAFVANAVNCGHVRMNCATWVKQLVPGPVGPAISLQPDNDQFDNAALSAGEPGGFRINRNRGGKIQLNGIGWFQPIVPP